MASKKVSIYGGPTKLKTTVMEQYQDEVIEKFKDD